MAQTHAIQSVYNVVEDPKEEPELVRAAFLRCSGVEKGVLNAVIPVMMGRHIVIPESSGAVARFDFQTLCQSNVGAADFLALAQRFHTIIVSGVPMMVG